MLVMMIIMSSYDYAYDADYDDSDVDYIDDCIDYADYGDYYGYADRHRDQNKQILVDIRQDGSLSQVQKSQALADQKESMRGEWRDRLTALLKGSCLAPCLLCL